MDLRGLYVSVALIEAGSELGDGGGMGACVHAQMRLGVGEPLAGELLDAEESA